MFVLSTAGHIDHGKSVLVQALTGIDPDRLREEKERGMTIDLGFAWLKLPSGQEVGIIDVPGHERFINNMLAGVGGVDLAVLIVAANEGIMPQTREHLAILDLLEIQRGIVVITKKDLVDEEWVGLLRMDIEELIGLTSLSQAPIIAVSALTGEGLPDLVSTMDEMLSSTESREDIGRPRLPIDRVFTIAGSGTIVTGTLIDGSLFVGQEVEIIPPGIKSRLRGLQTHKAQIDGATPGSRVAANLVRVATSQLQRGDVLTKPGWLMPTTMLSVQLRLLPYLRRPLPHNATVSFHTGAAETMAKIRLLEKDKLEPGETAWAQLVLNKPVALVNGDHFIVRSSAETLGGGKVAESHTKRLRRFRPTIIQNLKVKEGGTTEEVLLSLLETKQPLELPTLLRQCDLPAGEVQPVMESLIRQEKVVGVGQRDQQLLFTALGWERLIEQTTSILENYHRSFPTRAGMPKVELGNRLKLGKYSSDSWQRLLDAGILNERGLVVSLPSHSIRLTQSQQTEIDTFLQSLVPNPYAPPGDQIPESDLLNLLVEQHKVVKVSDSVVFSASAYDEMAEEIISYIKVQGKVTLAEARDLFKTSRKYAQALLEHLDENKITRRTGDERILY
ncbi:selenocysteine-specific translation elongation factor [Chloroflexota bacterium]